MMALIILQKSPDKEAESPKIQKSSFPRASSSSSSNNFFYEASIVVGVQTRGQFEKVLRRKEVHGMADFSDDSSMMLEFRLKVKLLEKCLEGESC